MTKEKFKENVTKAINSAKLNKKFASMESITLLTPELEILYNIRLDVTNALKNNLQLKSIDNLYDLVCSTELMKISYKKLAKNYGAGTKGSDNESIEKFSIEKQQHPKEQKA